MTRSRPTPRRTARAAAADLVGCNACIFLQPGRAASGIISRPRSNKPLNTATGIRPQRVTLIAWVRRNTFPANDEVIAGQVSGQVTCDGMSYALTHRGGVSDAGVDFAIRQPGGTFVATPTDTNVDDGDWHMLAGTFDGSSVRLFVDGVHVGSTPTPAAAIEYTSASAAFGIDGYTGPCVTPDYQGDLDEIRVYDRALSATEIARLASPAATTPPVLVPDAGPGPRPLRPLRGIGLPARHIGGSHLSDLGRGDDGGGHPGQRHDRVQEDQGPLLGRIRQRQAGLQGQEGREVRRAAAARTSSTAGTARPPARADPATTSSTAARTRRAPSATGDRRQGHPRLQERRGRPARGGSGNDKLNCSKDKKSAKCTGDGGKDTLDCRNGEAACSGGSGNDKLNCSKDKKSAKCTGNGGKDTPRLQKRGRPSAPAAAATT